ncbi:MAG: DUF1127 domain-containing protein [Pseudomonadota bacterium]|jgi:uncharacterized protein YjiS (DUF1127 family)|uniref:YjiS-like domain-containing protein n=1 Tax=Thalassovita autumnalis TaxID=2072972 RepID=A0A0P1FWT2_9RHOB|nr:MULTISPECIES: DUF1127 domain-containing protein [Thalassovita]MEC7964509.1 DUF1127 domain-containing protein [Pseudomonadota bacterium]MEC8040037.1 DUF1127 domain-containing protein [Pseudomonadota bacterium]MEC8295145.1 DUF1127 domain-containing protein [Pseudomonadota bacterium]CUH68330.1 hypothetical protein TL5118_02584 [Thalassovita autumnalis]CUH73454.1 hypothetical protein TL5120_03263 [Thalassovita autumnalis]
MALNAVNHIENAGLVARMGQLWSGLVQGMIAYGESRSRFNEIQALERMSDRELADIGLKRDQIVRHVFRDQFYL